MLHCIFRISAMPKKGQFENEHSFIHSFAFLVFKCCENSVMKGYYSEGVFISYHCIQCSQLSHKNYKQTRELTLRELTVRANLPSTKINLSKLRGI